MLAMTPPSASLDTVHFISSSSQTESEVSLSVEGENPKSHRPYVSSCLGSGGPILHLEGSRDPEAPLTCSLAYPPLAPPPPPPHTPAVPVPGRAWLPASSSAQKVAQL